MSHASLDIVFYYSKNLFGVAHPCCKLPKSYVRRVTFLSIELWRFAEVRRLLLRMLRKTTSSSSTAFNAAAVCGLMFMIDGGSPYSVRCALAQSLSFPIYSLLYEVLLVELPYFGGNIEQDNWCCLKLSIFRRNLPLPWSDCHKIVESEVSTQSPCSSQRSAGLQLCNTRDARASNH